MPQALVSDARRSQLMLVEVGVAHPSGQAVGAAGDFTGPWGLASGWAVADTGADRLVFFSDPQQPLDSATVLGGFKRPAGVTLAADGSAYVADTGNARIVHTRPDGSDRVVFDDAGAFREPYAVAVDAFDRIWVADRLLGRVVRMDGMDGTGWTVMASGAPVGLVSVDDLVLVCDLGARELVLRDADSTSVAGRIPLPGPAAAVYDGATVYALDAVSGRVHAFDTALAPAGPTVHLKDLGAVAPRGLALT